jgi:outer membrane protein assembly factor BamB
MGKIHTAYRCFVSTTDPEGEGVSYEFDWGNGDTSAWSRFLSSGLTCVDTNAWSRDGRYSVRARAKDPAGAVSDWSKAYILSIGNRAPTTPQILFTPDSTWPGIRDSISVLAFDPDIDSIVYVVDWGDTVTTSAAPLRSGTIATIYRTLLHTGTFHFRVQARDARGLVSDWSESHNVQVPGPDLLWRVPAQHGNTVVAPPAIGPDRTIYFIAGKTLHALSPDGLPRWGYVPSVDENPVSVGPKNVLYVRSAPFIMSAIPISGTRPWSWQLSGPGSTSQVKACALGLNGVVYHRAAQLYAWDANGELLWKSDEGGTNASAPVVGADGTIYFQSQSKSSLYALNPDGSLRWTARCPSPPRNSPPAIGLDGVIYCGQGHGLTAFDANGNKLWELRVSANHVPTQPAVGRDGTIYYAGAHGITAINPDGSIKWVDTTGRAVETTPAITADGAIIFGCDDYSLHALDPDGTLRWKRGTDGKVLSSPTIATDGTVCFGSSDGYLYAILGDSPLADAPWPMFQHDAQHTGRAQ